MKIKRALVWPEFFMPSTIKAISNENDVAKQSLKSVFFRTYLGKSFDPKIHKNCPIEFIDFNGTVFGSNDFPKYVLKENRL